MEYFKPSSKLFANLLKDRAISLLENSNSEEYFVVFTSFLEILRFENYKGFNNFNNNYIEEYNDLDKLEKAIFKEIFKDLWDETKAKKINSQLSLLEFDKGNEKYKILPYLVDNQNESEFTNL